MKRSPLKRTTRLAPVNRKRKAVAFARNFGAKAEWIRSLPCAIAAYGRFSSVCGGGTEAAHAKSRGAGGVAASLVPLCAFHHRKQHGLGIQTFDRLYGTSLVDLSEVYERRWQAINA